LKTRKTENKTSSGKQENVFRKEKQKTETIQKTKLKAMKTTNNVQKTENRNFRKQAIKLVAAVAVILLVPTTLDASELVVKQRVAHEDQHLLAFANTGKVSQTSSTANDFFTETASESAIELEKWMTDESFFVAPAISFAAETEENLEVEEWMVNNQNFTKVENTTDNEIALSIEDWMLDESIWGM
jgi:hypothetical protein